MAVGHSTERGKVLCYQLGLRKTKGKPLAGQAVEVHQGVAEKYDSSGNGARGSDGERTKTTQGTPCRRVLYSRRQLWEHGCESVQALPRAWTELCLVPQKRHLDLLRA